jgi:hypothetical protein
MPSQNYVPEDTEQALGLYQETPLAPEEQVLLDETTEEPILLDDPAVVPGSTKRLRRRLPNPFPDEPDWSPANVLGRRRRRPHDAQLNAQAKELKRAVDALQSLNTKQDLELQARREL